MFDNIEKNLPSKHGLAGWRGWDMGKRLWQIYEVSDRLEGKFMASNGEKFMYGDSLDEMSRKLKITSSYPFNRTFPL